ncbi:MULTISPECIES: hypothetical protein [unclassified Tolypothrix]|uniref:hypothetical protein n=1 Tax=unclassified Tolypothrix TaxID=2649714 RepID=UPI0005EAC701|nr:MULTISPECIES: hypothetical protein [unclassified Tolypothrix]BAY95328.1 hypothetical protein NIES3275_73850 [Microchaete diplosiphon NIES-3275]EKE96715.1 hypothetical protein FDUTEX481_06380 [Tolypothrix sp. PCC 7601]MBE9084547.1 hypothetical protein [Tolypothrix sp. LEGE 11397]UYD30548.1 hypothetical protein HGR01_36805 [Tolypothrix sp. PCC 7712]UYD38321.1 hypothetical protein HG267_38120 [Tolypothrix sp. PCC 7601]
MMRDLFKKTASEPQQSSAVLRVIGDRSSGKTTYMASLARWPNADPSSPVQSVISVNEAGEELITKAQNLLEQGLALEPSNLDASAADIKDYTLRITLKGQFSWKNAKASIGSKLVNLNISCKDYAGEFFADLLQQSGNPKLREYLDDCLQATGIMFLVDGNSRRKDLEYVTGLDKFLTALDRSDIMGGKRRISLVLTKCEQSELWVNRHKPAFVAEARFPQVYRKLQTWQQMGAGRVDYFTTSAFGMLGNNFPEPNVNLLSRGREGIAAVIKEPKRWRPFGLVAPIYWLCTGDRHKELDKG